MDFFKQYLFYQNCKLNHKYQDGYHKKLLNIFPLLINLNKDILILEILINPINSRFIERENN